MKSRCSKFDSPANQICYTLGYHPYLYLLPSQGEEVSRAGLTAKNPARQSRNQSSKLCFTAETQSSQRSEYFLIKNSLLAGLSVSAVSSFLDRYG